MPIGGQRTYDRFGHAYNVTRVLDSTGRRFDLSKYEAYSAMYLPGPFAMVYLLAFTLSTALLVHTLLYHGRTIYVGIKGVEVEKDDVHTKLMRSYSEVPGIWYASISLVFFMVAVVAVESWPTDMPVWAIMLSLLLSMIYLLPCGFIYATTGQAMSINLLAQIIPGGLLNGRPLANMVCSSFLLSLICIRKRWKTTGELTRLLSFPARLRVIRSSKATLSRRSLRHFYLPRTSSWATTSRSRPVRRS